MAGGRGRSTANDSNYRVAHNWVRGVERVLRGSGRRRGGLFERCMGGND